MSVTSRWTGPDPSAIGPALVRLQSDTLASVMARLRRGAEAAYAGTRFAGTFVVHEESLFSRDPIFQYVELDTRPHGIDAKRGPYLHFKIGDRWVRTAHVNHPGTTGKHRLDALFDAFGAEVGAKLSSGWEHLHVE